MFSLHRSDADRTRSFGAGPARLGLVTLVYGAVLGLASCVGGDGTGDAIIDPNPVADTIGPAGGALTIGEVELVFPPNAVSQVVGITVREALTFPSNPLVVPGAVYELRPSNLQFAEPVQLALGYDPGGIPAGVRESELRLYRVSGLAWQKVSGSVPDEAGNRVSGEIGAFSIYGVLGVPVATVSISPGVATIGVGETVQLTGIPEDGEGLALPDREVVWTTSSPGVAEVDGSGLVTGVGLGTAEIRATSEGQSATATITAGAVAGSLQVTTSTNGRDLPPGYTVTVDGSASQAIGINDQVTFPDLEEGDYVVELSGVAPNCAVQGDNPRTVSVPSGGAGATTFSVDCAAVTGDLEVTSSTTGTDLDLDGYRVTVDGSTSRSIGTNDVELFQNLEVGSHEVELTDLAVNCTVDQAKRTVDVEAGETARTTFVVSCVPLIGDLRVKTSTSGSNKPDEYVVVVDETESQPIGTKDEVDFLGLDSGEHVVRLEVASNCHVQGDNPRTVVVPFDDRVETKFEVSCE